MMVTWDAKSRVKYNCEKDDFYSESGIVPREQISNALDAYGFGMHYEAGELVSEDKSISIEVEVYTIIVKRVKEKTDDSKQYTKK